MPFVACNFESGCNGWDTRFLWKIVGCFDLKSFKGFFLERKQHNPNFQVQSFHVAWDIYILLLYKRISNLFKAKTCGVALVKLGYSVVNMARNDPSNRNRSSQPLGSYKRRKVVVEIKLWITKSLSDDQKLTTRNDYAALTPCCKDNLFHLKLKLEFCDKELWRNMMSLIAGKSNVFGIIFFGFFGRLWMNERLRDVTK